MQEAYVFLNRKKDFFHIVASNWKEMKGEIINCSTHKDIYFLETNATTRSAETTNLANLFASPAGREMFKYKTRPKLKQKLNPALEFFIQNKTLEGNKSGGDNKCAPSNSSSAVDECRSRRNSIDLYEEAASILGLTCSQTDDCKCIECQCHYFDFEDDIDYGGECVIDHSSSCTIQ